MKNEVEQIALQNDMSIEFVTWFFNEKKVGCGNVWFMMMAAMWEGWKGRCIEMDKLAAENVALKSFGDTLFDMYKGLEISGGGIHDEQSVVCQQAALDAAMSAFEEIETPSTDRLVAGIKADGVEEFAAKLRIPGDDQFFDALAKGVALAADDFAKQLREGAK
ncbi:hypothetical protein J9B54_00990 [Klebsiella pneumoniae]|nr:hypothetical protein [Klebsiella pneumoniae]HBZ1073864.1 hypothetical protein [Klebsiella pneumoniae]HBZ1403091.1 hypothetical protein [Klebsiella pneumoniae]